MNVLAFDTAMGACSAAVLVNGDVKADHYEPLARGHAEVLMGMIQKVCDEAGIAISDLDRIGVTTGPGTFTGQRVGLSAARAMVLGTDIQIIGVTTLEAVAAAVTDAQTHDCIATVFDARRGEAYVQLFEPNLAPITEPAVMTPKDAVANFCEHAGGRQIVLAGTGVPLVIPGLAIARQPFLLSAALGQPDAPHIARLASTAPSPFGEVPSPFYLRAPDAKLPASAPRTSEI